MSNPPIDFEKLAKQPKGVSSNTYPYAINSKDLMENFVFATLDVDPDLVEEMIGSGGYLQRRLKIPAPPTEPGTFVLGAINGSLLWLETEGCV